LIVSYHNLFHIQSIYQFPRKIDLAKAIRGFKLIISRELDSLSELAFYLVGNIDEATAKTTNLEMENNLKKNDLSLCILTLNRIIWDSEVK
jgi:hypothetical protein